MNALPTVKPSTINNQSSVGLELLPCAKSRSRESLRQSACEREGDCHAINACWVFVQRLRDFVAVRSRMPIAYDYYKSIDSPRTSFALQHSNPLGQSRARFSRHATITSYRRYNVDNQLAICFYIFMTCLSSNEKR
jgi:hypothetical protein